MAKKNGPAHSEGPERRHHPKPKHHGAYEKGPKVADSLMCDDCNVVHHGGRWYWGAPPFGEVRGGVCPACRRVRDRHPAGVIRIPTPLVRTAGDVEHLLRSIEQIEKAEHPLERIIAIETQGDDLRITTTGIHMARRITSQLERRLHKKPRIHYGDGTEMHATWDADDQGDRER